jgi:voltage-dependent calcium channel T type alpha-1G
MYYCSGPNINEQKILTKDDCLKYPENEWINYEFNFDNFGSALMTLFIIACKDGWSQIMYRGIDAVGVDRQPIENYNEWMLLYFISFLILNGFLMSNLFVGVIINCFQQCYVLENGEIKQSHLKSEETLCAEEYLELSKVRKFFYDICNNRYFDFMVAILTCLNIIIMSVEHYRMSHVI